jgi:hypothetical protein
MEMEGRGSRACDAGDAHFAMPIVALIESWGRASCSPAMMAMRHDKSDLVFLRTSL